MWLGVNPIAIYFLSEVSGRLLDAGWIDQSGEYTTMKSWVFWAIVEPAFRPSPAAASLAFGLALVALWVAVAAVLHRNRIRIHV